MAHSPSFDSALATLWSAMQAQGDFPALAQSVAMIVRLIDSDEAHADRLAEFVLRDLALTSRVLRLANSAVYRRAGMPAVTTISRAIIVLGFETVKKIALTSAMLEHFGKAPSAVVDELVHSLSIAFWMERWAKRTRMPVETAFLQGLFRRLGQLLVQYYFPERAEKIAALTAAGMPGEKAEHEALGVSCAAFGMFVARQWELPLTVVQGMELASGKAPGRWPEGQEAGRWLASAAEQLVLMQSQGVAMFEVVKKLVQSYPFLQRFDERVWAEMAAETVEEIKTWWSLFKSSSPPQALRRLEKAMGSLQPRQEKSAPLAREFAGEEALDAAVSATGQLPFPALMRGIEELSQSILERQPLATIGFLACEVVWQALRCQRVVIFEVTDAVLQPRWGVGKDWERIKTGVRYSLREQNVFSLAVQRGLDIAIDDVTSPEIHGKLPRAFAAFAGSRSFVLLPVKVGRQVRALAYLDRPDEGTSWRTAEVTQQLRLWRNQLALALVAANASG